MEVKEAVAVAKRYTADLLADEGLTNLGLEEIEHDDASGVWRVTLGFSRPWNHARNVLTAMTGDGVGRSYKVLTIRDADGTVLSVRSRDVRN